MHIYRWLRATVLGLFLTIGAVTLTGQCLTPCSDLSTPVAEDSKSSSSVPDGVSSQNSSTGQGPSSPGPMSVKKVFVNLPGDQKAIWTSPFRLRWHDSAWLVPLAGATGVLIGSDQHSMVRARSNTNAINRSSTLSDAGAIGIAAVPAFMYVWGSLQGASRARETGLLTGEALINSYGVNAAFKLIFQRERPTVTDGQGRFLQSFTNASFPSNHSMLSWTAASVIAHEYPGVVSQLLAYGTASMVSITRVTARKHFPSDVVVGAAMGWLIGRQVYRAHHDTDLEGSEYGAFSSEPGEFDPAKLGSPFVTLDSWVYPALERLAALGYHPAQ